MRIDADFLKHSVRLRVEGFEQQKLLSACLSRHILVKDIRFENEISMTLRISRRDVAQFKKTAGSRYRITVLAEVGARPVAGRLFAKKSTILGLVVFAALLFYQSSFVSEIRIYGYEINQESEVRAALEEAGLYEGASKSVDLNDVEAQMYGKLDNLSWIGIKYIGNMAEVTMVEGSSAPEKMPVGGPANVVADKAGYIEKVIPRVGQQAVEKGTYVNPGDVVITGLLPVSDTTYKQGENVMRAVRAEGEVWARILYRFTRYQERYEIIRRETGRSFYGVSLQIGDLKLDTGDCFWPYKAADREERQIFRCIRPFPVRFAVTKQSEVELFRRERTEDEIRKLAAAQSREAAKENIPENTQILNNSLKFTDKENIIEVTIMLHALEEIGKEQSFEFNTTGSGIGQGTGGTTAFGESTE
ncbi:sporulation protein YqfD [Bacilliculturomica massiliensis]|uniref:sporulation protein YqfD n=1 Tax=Bacilliculturomica massiliensis TaxID=1917867 RepID=UPI00102FF35C|nr:sporulation protein YqfD [Bacilliculturomica massiliensis]